MTTHDAIHLTDQYVLNTYGRRAFAFEEGKGACLYDLEGGEYLDFTSGLGVNALGYNHPVIVEAVREQAAKVIHTSNLFYIPSQALLAKKLCESSFGERVFFSNSGAEAVEGALKFARKWGKQFQPPKTDVVAFKNSFHGRTFGALSATMQEKYQKGFDPLLPGFSYAELNNIVSLERALTEKTAAVIIEPLQGEGGVNFAKADFMREVKSLCSDRDILLIVDEVQCGLGRTGKLFAHEHSGVTPDMMTLAKPLAGGLPIGAVIVGGRVWPHIQPGEHASTFGGNHFVTSVALRVFDCLSDKRFLDDVAEKGEYFTALLLELKSKYPCIKEVRGAGFLLGVLVDFTASDAVAYFDKERILICTAGPDVIRFIPPLIVTKKEIARVVTVLDTFLSGRQ